LLNRILGEKIAIISSKPQTTRNRILGVCHRPNAQIVFYDTPGIFSAKDPLNVKIVDTALGAIGDADVLLAVADAATRTRPPRRCWRRRSAPEIAGHFGVEQIDLVADKEKLLEIIAVVSTAFLRGRSAGVRAGRTQVEELIAAILKGAAAGPPYFPEDTLTDATERFIAAELIREKIFRLTGERSPTASAVTVESFKTAENGKRVNIEATIHLERDSQKGSSSARAVPC